MNPAPRLSVVVTNYNYARHLTAAVDSALDQRGGGVEVIVVDDGSTDDSLNVLAPFGDRITVIAQENGGQGSAFNAGFAASSADLVVFLDADDLLDSDLADRLEHAFGNPDVGRVQFVLDTIDAAGRPLGGSVPDAGVALAHGDVRPQLVAFPDDISWQPTSGNAFRRTVLEAILPMPTDEYRICADYYLSNLSPVHGTIGVLDEVGGSYRIHSANGHYASAWTLDAIRANVVRTSVTHRHLIDHGSHHGLDVPDDPSGFASVTALAHRMVSLRLAPDQHPMSGDTRVSLGRAGVRAGIGRFDQPVTKRAGYAAWFVVAAIAPRRSMQRIAAPFINVSL